MPAFPVAITHYSISINPVAFVSYPQNQIVIPSNTVEILDLP